MVSEFILIMNKIQNEFNNYSNMTEAEFIYSFAKISDVTIKLNEIFRNRKM